MEKIRTNMIELHKSSEHVSVGATELATASQILAETAEEQSTSIEQLATTTNAVADQVENSRQEAETSAKATAQTTGSDIISFINFFY